MLIDTHIHVGQFYGQYYSPSYVSELMSDVGVNYYAVSSTSMCEEKYQRVLDEIRELVELDGDRVLPIMWITPEGLKGNIAWFLESEIKWRCLKVHPELHPDDWKPGGGQFDDVIEIASELSLPLLIHTGEKECCMCGKYEALVASHPNVTFIFAHGRPFQDAIRIASSYRNVFVDTAFMPVEIIYKFVKQGLSNKLLWGTDMCIPKHFYPQSNMALYYLEKLNKFNQLCEKEQFDAITYKNAANVLSFKQISNCL